MKIKNKGETFLGFNSQSWRIKKLKNTIEWRVN